MRSVLWIFHTKRQRNRWPKFILYFTIPKGEKRSENSSFPRRRHTFSLLKSLNPIDKLEVSQNVTIASYKRIQNTLYLWHMFCCSNFLKFWTFLQYYITIEKCLWKKEFPIWSILFLGNNRIQYRRLATYFLNTLYNFVYFVTGRPT